MMKNPNCLLNGKWRYSFLFVFAMYWIIWIMGCSADSSLDGKASSQTDSAIGSSLEDSAIKLYINETYGGWEEAYKNIILNAEDFLRDLHDLYGGT